MCEFKSLSMLIFLKLLEDDTPMFASAEFWGQNG